MDTKMIRSITEQETAEAVKEATALLAAGEVIAFPTETVYGLGADATDPEAVLKIFAAKGRPADNPLIVHVSEQSQVKGVAREIPENARRLMRAFWPGPLSIVLHKNNDLPAVTTGGLDTVVVRFPSHPVATALIEAFGKPIAAPSANRSGRPSPTTAEHVMADLKGRIPLIIGGGPVEYGLESTVVDCTVEPPVILRPGAITLEALQAVIPTITLETPHSIPRSPGMKYRHYSPDASVILFVGKPDDTARAMQHFLSSCSGLGVGIIWYHGSFPCETPQYHLAEDEAEAAPRLFAALREIDDRDVDTILVQGYPEHGLGAAIMNRLKKAASKVIVC